MSVSNFTTVYTKGIIKVEASTPFTGISHLLNCYCKTVGAEHKEKSYLLKRVNFYKFREYMQTVNGVTNWFVWYTENNNTPAFNEALASYINHIENRTAVYVCKNGSKIDRLTYKVIEQGKQINQYLV